MIHLQTIGLKPLAKKQSGFPFSLPLVQNFGEIELRSPVAFFPLLVCGGALPGIAYWVLSRWATRH